MKKLLILLFSLFFLSSPSVYADDISDFKIEGISIGDNLLFHMTKDEILEEIEKTKDYYSYLNEPYKYFEVTSRKKFPIFTEGLSFFIKNNSANKYISSKKEIYTILGIRGFINYDSNYEGCIQKRNEIEEDVYKIFLVTQRIEDIDDHPFDPSGKSIVNKIRLELNSGGEAHFDCVKWEENFKVKNNFYDSLSVNIISKEIVVWGSNQK